MSFDKARAITFAISYLTDELKKKDKTRLPAKELAIEINKYWKGSTIDHGKISAILRGWHLPDDKLDGLLDALQRLLNDRKLKLELSAIPPALERKYELPTLFQSNIPHGLQGEVVGDLGSNMAGPWLFYYVSPIDRAGARGTEIRSTVAYIYEAAADARSMDVRMVSNRGIWTGTLFATGSHVYVVLSDIAKNDVRKTETIFFLVNRPHSRQPFIAGIGTALIRKTHHAVPPVFGFILFGERQRGKAGAKGEKAIDPSIRAAFENVPPRETELATIRGRDCLSYSWAEFVQKHSDLAAYAKSLEINGEKLGDKIPDLLLRWP